MPIIKLVGAGEPTDQSEIQTVSGRYSSLYFSAGASPELARNFALREIPPLNPHYPASEEHDAEMQCWSFGEHILIRDVFSGALPQQVRNFHVWDVTDCWSLVLAKTSFTNRNLSSGPSVGESESRSGPSRLTSRTRYVELLTLVAPALPMELSAPNVAPLPRVNIGASLALSTYIDSLASLLPAINCEDAPRISAMTRSLIAAYFAPLSSPSPAADQFSSLMLFERARRIVRQHMASPELGPDQLCRLLAVSRSKLYRLFESDGGVVHFINAERLNYAHDRLRDPLGRSTINKICNDVGFSDHSTFSRAFKRKFGCSPSEARRRTNINLSDAPPFRIV